MTAADDVLVPGFESPGAGAPDADVPDAEAQDTGAPGIEDAPARRRTRVWPRLLAGFVLGLVATVGIATAALVVWDSGYEGRVLPGVRAGDVDLSGLDRPQAEAALTAAYEALGTGRVVIRTAAGDVSVPYTQFGRRADVGAMVDEALAAGREGTVAERAVAEIRLTLEGRAVEPRLVLDETALSAGVAEALSWLEREPVDASIAKGARRVYTFPARDGRTYDAAAVAATALDAVRRLDAPGETVVEAATITLPPARSDADVAAVGDAAKRMVANIVVTHGEKHWTIKAATVATWLDFEYRADGSIAVVADEAKIEKALAKVAKAVKRVPVSATFLGGKGSRAIGVAPSRDGRRLDPEATAAAIARLLAARAHWIEPAPVRAVVARVEPKLTTEEAAKTAPVMSRLGSWKTWFPVSERNYFGANIWLPARIIDGTVLRPGQTFEWWRAIGPVTPSRGFGPGGFIAGNHTEPTGALGGGMCSSSTTLFNAALRAGLKMGARSNHKYYIDRYPLGLDATVSKMPGGGGQTVTFTNDMKHPIVIRTYRYRAKGRGWVRYEIWGIPDGRTVSIGKPVVSNVRKATTYTVYVSTLPHGVKEQTEYPANGMDVSVTRVVRDRNGRVIHSNTYRTHYQLWNGRIEIGL
jgi:vancomycin resistance protein YoaR